MKSTLLALCVLVLSSSQAAAQYVLPKDRADHPLLGGYNGAKIVLQESLPYEAFPFVTALNEDSSPTLDVVEGKITHHTYETNGPDSVLRIGRNYETALAENGFKIFVNCNKETCGSNIPKDVLASRSILKNKFYAGHVAGNLHGFAYLTTQAHWTYQFITAQKQEGDNEYFLTLVIVQSASLGFASISQDIVQRKALELNLIAEPISLDELEQSVTETGFATLDGIYFDTGTAVLSTGSTETLSTIATYLRSDPSKVFYVVGHTDSVGSQAANLDLGKRRAQAVVNYLTQNEQIEPARLKPEGVGEIAPVATNANEEGRAQNRRVELLLK